MALLYLNIKRQHKSLCSAAGLIKCQKRLIDRIFFCWGAWIAASYLLAMTVPLSSLRAQRGNRAPVVIANEVTQSMNPKGSKIFKRYSSVLIADHASQMRASGQFGINL
jgi:hypothetical protein